MKRNGKTVDLGLLTVPAFIPRYRVCLVPESRHTGPLTRIDNSNGAANALRPFFAGLDREHFIVCALDAKHAIIGVNLVSVGSLSLSIVHPREVMKSLILLNASAWIAAHNHPSGDPTPSPEDRELTKRLREVSEILGIRLLDHVILGEARHYSFADHDWPCGGH